MKRALESFHQNLKLGLKHNRRGMMRSITAWFLFGAIILVFIFWGMQSRMQQGMAQGGSAAVVNNTMISISSLSEAMERLRQDPQYEQLASMGGDAGRQMLTQQALSQLIQGELLRQASDDNRIWTADGEVRDVITGIPAFQQDGKFRKERYMQYLDSIRKTPAEFEEEIRKQQSLHRTVDLFRTALAPLPAEKALLDEASRIQANLEFVALQTESIVPLTAVSKADVESYLKDAAHAAKVKENYQARVKEFSTAETVHARHILIKATKGDSASEKAALEKAQMIKAKLAKKEDFAKLAKQFSDDPGSKEKGGDLQSFARGRMVPAFDQAAFSLPVGQVSDPVKTDFGFHLIEVLEKKPASTRTLEQAQSEIAAQMIAKERSATELAKLEELLRKPTVGDVQKFLDAHNLKWQETGAFSAQAESIPKIGANDDVLHMAFELSESKPLPNRLVHQGPTAYLVRYKPVAAAAIKKPESDANKVDLMASFMANQRAEDALKQWLDSLRKTAKISVNLQMGPSGGGAPPSSDE